MDLDAPGSINGVPLLEVDLDSFEDKPWRKPGKIMWFYFNTQKVFVSSTVKYCLLQCLVYCPKQIMSTETYIIKYYLSLELTNVDSHLL